MGSFLNSNPAILPTPTTRPVLPTGVPTPYANLPPVKNWSHPFKDRRDPLQQLNHLAKAAAGYYPLGVSGLWHGGVHFDGGTAGTLDQSSVCCLADGEVVAYRIDQHTPTTGYIHNKSPVLRPFSRNFVLVRHRLQPPAIKDSHDTPPSLIFYSLYMHLQDWTAYNADTAVVRPPFWAEGATYCVKESVKDTHASYPRKQGLNIRNRAQHGEVLALLPHGLSVTVSGEGTYRKIENTPGPDFLRDASGALLGYLPAKFLEPILGGQYRVKRRQNLHAEANAQSATIVELFSGAEVTLSGEGELRKLEHINQYVHFDSLRNLREPLAHDRVVVLDQPVPIKAGDLIGHIGLYQDGFADQPERKLHLEVFSGDDMDADAFIKASRDWAQRLPAEEKTWLKLTKGTAVVTHQDRFSAQRPPTLHAAHTLSAADLLIPRSLLDSLPAERKITVPAASGRKACNWYRLDGLLHDADNVLLEGWIREEVGVTPWFSPWSWEGYDVIYNYDAPEELLASFHRATNRFSEEQLERYGAKADMADKGPMKSRLYDIIDSNRDGKMTAEELQVAISLPAYAQSLSQLVIYYESEWYHRALKWDLLDEILGHSGSTPNVNWLAEKERIKQLSWWDEVAEKVGLPAYGKVYHFHPVGLVGCFNDDNDLKWLKVPYGQLTFDVEGNDIEDESHRLYRYFSRVVHWPGGKSGITIGRGYDLGQQPDPESDLRAAGIEEPLLSWLIEAKGLQEDRAKAYFVSAPEWIRKHKITRKQQYDLFLPVYEYMKNDVIRISRLESVDKQYGALNWSSVSNSIQDVMVDLRYRGDYGLDSRKFIQKPFVDNDLGRIRQIINNAENWKGVPDDRFNRRAEYLRK